MCCKMCPRCIRYHHYSRVVLDSGDLIENPHILFRVTNTSDNTGKTSYSSVTRKASVVLCDILFISVMMRFYCIIWELRSKLQNINSVTDMTDTPGYLCAAENNNPAKSVPKVFADSEMLVRHISIQTSFKNYTFVLTSIPHYPLLVNCQQNLMKRMRSQRSIT